MSTPRHLVENAQPAVWLRVPDEVAFGGELHAAVRKTVLELRSRLRHRSPAPVPGLGPGPRPGPGSVRTVFPHGRQAIRLILT